MKQIYIIVCILSCLVIGALACTQTPTDEQPNNADRVATSSMDSVEGEATSTATDTPAPTTETQLQPFLETTDLLSIELLTPQAGVGIKPEFAWKPVEGATWYSLALLNQAGDTYWAWMGPETKIFLGGVATQPAEEAAGPRLSLGMSWAVLGYDEAGNIIASSVLQPISP